MDDWEDEGVDTKMDNADEDLPQDDDEENLIPDSTELLDENGPSETLLRLNAPKDDEQTAATTDDEVAISVEKNTAAHELRKERSSDSDSSQENGRKRCELLLSVLGIAELPPAFETLIEDKDEDVRRVAYDALHAFAERQKTAHRKNISDSLSPSSTWSSSTALEIRPNDSAALEPQGVTDKCT